MILLGNMEMFPLSNQLIYLLKESPYEEIQNYPKLSCNFLLLTSLFSRVFDVSFKTNERESNY